MPKPKASHRPRYGQGSFYWDKNRKVWRGVIEAGTDHNGKRRRFTVSSRDEDEAWNRLQQKIDDVKAGKTTLSNSDALTVRDWLTDWLKQRKTLVRPKTYATDAGQLRKWVLPKYGKLRMKDLNATHVNELGQTMRAEGISTTTIRYTQRIWQQAANDALAGGYTVPEPFLRAKKAGSADPERQAIPLDDAIGLVSTASTLDYGTRWLAALLQGMRQGECLGLTWAAVDLDAGTLSISWQLQELPYEDRERETFRVPDGYRAHRLQGRFHLVRPKSKRGAREIPLIPQMVTSLRRWRDIAPVNQWGLVWANPDGSIRTAKQDRAEWRALQRQADVSKFGKPYVLHEARNTTATLLLAAGVDPAIITAILGHSSIVTSHGYMTVGRQMKREALEAVGNLLEIGT